jgi:hypothetical protein
MGTFGGCPQKAQSLHFKIQIETSQNRRFPQTIHQLITVFREDVGTPVLLFLESASGDSDAFPGWDGAACRKSA